MNDENKFVYLVVCIDYDATRIHYITLDEEEALCQLDKIQWADKVIKIPLDMYIDYSKQITIKEKK